MTELAPCPRCHRHVAVHETTCPFCRAAVSGLRAVHHIPAKLVRVAVLTAALAGCSDKKSAEPPPAGSAAGSAQGSDDLEKMLDHDGTTVQHAAPADAALDAYAVADAIDAGVAADAGLSQEELAAQKEKQRERLEERRRKKALEEQRRQQLDRVNVKPYGAPSARRRVV